MLGQTQTTTTTRTTKRLAHDTDEQISRNRNEKKISELDEKYMQSKIRITRKYKGKTKKKFFSFSKCIEISLTGNILIKFIDVDGRFVEIENTGNQTRDLTGWRIERIIDGRRINYTFPVFELDSHKTVRIYGNYHQRSSLSNEDDSYLQLIASNFSDWNTGLQMRTELFNQDNIGKALFEQTIIQDL
jgi:hypothetical protein